MSADYFSAQVQQDIAATVAAGGIICYPTEAVWGLGCHPRSEKAFTRLLALKQRPAEKGVILIAATLAQVRSYALVSDKLLPKISKAWHDGNTCILPKTADCPDYLCGQHDSIAIRLSHYQVVQALCLAAGTALVSTSANRHNQTIVSDITAAKQLFKRGVDYYLDAPLGAATKPSRIIDFTQNPKVVIRD